MPELPEVQTVVNNIQPLIKNKVFLSYHQSWEKVLYSDNFKEISDTINNKKVEDVYRIGKYIIIELYEYYIAFHLRMTGYLHTSKNKNINKYVRCYFKFSDNTFLIYEDIRKFGGFYYIKNLNSIKNKLGIEPLSEQFKFNWVSDNLKIKKRQIKALLLDQSFIVGLGNIYIDEILWSSKIHPLSLSNMIRESQIKQFISNTKRILKDSINFHGTTIINFKFDNMKTGEYRKKLKVYNRKDQSCLRCNKKIIKIKVSSRGTYICPFCQII